MRWLCVISIVGCSGEPLPTPHGAMLRLLQPGGTPYSDGQDVTLVAGAQGGYHVWLDYQMTPAPSGDGTLERTAHRVSDDALVLRTMAEMDLGGPPMPLPMFMCPAPVGLSVLDQPIEYQLRFSNDKGEIARGSVTLVPHCPADSLELCQRICSG